MTVLGMVWLRGPCTIYAVMKELSASASTYYKSRAGTAYSVSKRLLKLELITQSADDSVSITSAGEAVLREWTGPHVPMMDVGHSADLLRLRFFFLEILPRDDRLRFVDGSIQSLLEFEKRCEELIPKNQAIGDFYGALATVCSILETRARIEWLMKVRQWVENPLSPDENWSDVLLQEINSPLD